jgi:F0F1-type ATP synthase assembly protein I
MGQHQSEPPPEQMAEPGKATGSRGSRGSRSTGTSPAAFAGVGLELAFLILLGLFVGQWIDKRLGTAPWLLILGVFAGAAAGFVNMYRILTTAERRARSHDNATTSKPSSR